MPYEMAHYVIIRSTDKWFGKRITSENDTVGTVEALKRFAFNDPVRNHATLPGPLFRAMIVHVQETNSMGLGFNGTYLETGMGNFCYGGNPVVFISMSDYALDNALQGTMLPSTALPMRSFYEDLDQALKAPARTLHDHVPYKMWANTYYSLRTSLQAQMAVKWHTAALTARSASQSSIPTTACPRVVLGKQPWLGAKQR